MPGPNEIKAGEAYVKLSTRDAELVKGLEKASKKLKAFGGDVKALGLGISAVGAAVLAPLGVAASYFSSYGDQVAKMAKRTGLSVQTLTELQFVASQTGTEFESLEMGFKKMQRSIYDAGRGLSTQVDAFNDLNLSFDQLKDLSPEDQFKLIADALGKVTDDTKQAAIAQQLFGRTGTNLIPMFEAGADGIDKLRARAKELGIVMSDEDAKSAEDFTDALDEMFKAGKMVLFQVGGALAPALSAASKTIAEIAASASAWVKRNREVIVTVGKVAAVVLALGATLTAIGYTSIAIGAAFGGVVKAIYAVTVASKALSAVWVFLAANPIALVLAAVAAAAAVVAYQMNRATRESEALSRATADMTARNDEQRRSDMQKLERLKTLAKSTKLNGDQMKEAQGLAADLEGRYGDLGITMDTVAGTINGVADAWAAMTKEMQRSATSDIDTQIAALEDQAKTLEEKLTHVDLYKDIMGGFKYGGREDYNKKVNDQVAGIYGQIVELQQRRRAIVGGDAAAMSGGGAGASPAGSAIIDNESAAARRVAQLRLQLIDDEHQKAIALINERYDNDIAEANKAGATQATLDDMEHARKLELQAEQRKMEKESFRARLDDTLRILEAEEQAAKEIADLESELDHKTREDRIKATMKGAEQEKALADERRRYELELLNIEEQRAIAAATAAGQSTDQVKREYELRRQLLGETQTTVSSRVDSVAQGTFNAAAIRGMFGGNTADRTAKASEATAQNTKELGRLFRQMLDQQQTFA